MAPAGSSVRDGKFQFTVKRFGVADYVNNGFQPLEPQGRFLMVELEVANIGNEPKTFFSDAQKLYIGGREYAPDSLAAVYLESASVDINPGNGTAVTIAFDIPASTKSVDYVQLHDSAFSRGAGLALQ